MERPKSTTNNVVSLDRPRRATNRRKSEEKWGKEVIDLGFTIIPSLLLQAQARLGLKPNHLAVLLQIIDFWWDEARKPYPSKKLLAQRLNLSERQVQRLIAELEKAGLLRRIERHSPNKGRQSNEYDLSGLVERLQRLAPEFQQAVDEAKALRRQIARRGGLGLRRNK